jgi:rare lipoprotein A
LNPRRILAALSLQALLLGAAGCHKNTRVAYQPPPPPAMNTGNADSSRPTRPDASNASVKPPVSSTPSAPQPIPQGKVVSSETGMASWYGPPYANHKGADGTIYDQNAMTAAHRTLPMGSIVRVTNLTNNESVVVRITDRGPFIDGRIIDLSLAAARAVDLYRPGTAKVRVEAYAVPDRPGVDPGGKWCVQIGAFLDEADAIQLKNDLARRYHTAKVIEFAGPTGHWVRINALNPDKATASQIADSIHVPDPAAQPYIVRLN